MEQFSSDQLKNLIDCDFENGLLYWKSRCADDFIIGSLLERQSRAKAYNKRWPGTLALNTLNPRTGYRFGSFLQKNIYAHRAILCMYFGEWPVSVDHINGDRSDNRLVNLRNVSHAMNMKNNKKRSDNTTGFNGVTWDKRRNKWVSRIVVEGRTINIGEFTDINVAAEARISYEQEHGFTARHGRC